MSAELKQLTEDLGREWKEFRSVLATGTEEQKKFGTRLGETEELLNKINGRLDEIEVKAQRPTGADVRAPVGSPSAAGKYTRNVLPTPGSLSTAMWPPDCVTVP